MTKRRRKKINKIMTYSTYKYIERGKFAYLFKQSLLYHKHEAYLCKMNRRLFKKNSEEILRKRND